MTGDWVCKFWLRGACKNGRDCRALHEITSINIDDAGDFLENIDRGSLLEAVESVPSVDSSDFEFLCSYNWVDSDKPTIYVPGKRTTRALELLLI